MDFGWGLLSLVPQMPAFTKPVCFLYANYIRGALQLLI